MKGLVKTQKSSEEAGGRSVFILRHGQTLLNKEDRIRGWSNIPLDDTGIREAQELGAEMRDLRIELDGLYSSDLLRSVQTALEVSKMTGIPLLGTTKALRPLDVGEYTGKDGKMAHKIIMDYAQNKPDEFIGGGESFNIFKFRVLSGIIGCLNLNRGLKLGFVSHSRGERLLHAWCALDCPEDLSIDLEEFGKKGEGTATASELTVSCPLVLS